MENKFEPEALGKSFSKHLDPELLEAAEPPAKDVLDALEKRLRARLAEAVVAAITTDYDIQRDGNILSIKVRLGQ